MEFLIDKQERLNLIETDSERKKRLVVLYVNIWFKL